MLEASGLNSEPAIPASAPGVVPFPPGRRPSEPSDDRTGCMATAYSYIDDHWEEGSPHIMGSMTHAVWMASVVFDGARAFEGVIPDLDLHCARVVESARVLDLEPMLTAGEIVEIAREGVAKFPKDAELYIRPMFYADDGFVLADPESTRFNMVVYELPMPEPNGVSACLSSFRRPAPETAPTDAKASCLYPNVGRSLREAHAKGFDTAVVLDPLGNVAEFATANLFLVKDGTVRTPALNGTFLNGITRQRVLQLLVDDGIAVEECRVGFPELLDADEVFQTSNYGKVLPVTRIEDHHLQAGPIYNRARKLYFDFARSQGG